MSKKKHPLVIQQFDDCEHNEFYSWGHHSQEDMVSAIEQSDLAPEKVSSVLSFDQEYAWFCLNCCGIEKTWMTEYQPSRGRKPLTSVRVEFDEKEGDTE